MAEGKHVAVIPLGIAAANAREILDALEKLQPEWREPMDDHNVAELGMAWFNPDPEYHAKLIRLIVEQPSWWLGQLEGALRTLVNAAEREARAA